MRTLRIATARGPRAIPPHPTRGPIPHVRHVTAIAHATWAGCYFERNLAEFLENFDAKEQDTEELTRVLAVSKDYIFSLRIKQFLAHLDMEMLFQNVPTLCNLDMTFQEKDVGMEYERSKFGMKMSDVASLQKALRVTETLTILSLPCNLLDDNTMRILATGLQGNSTITALDLSHNKIADRGVKSIAKLLNQTSVIISLNLSDNHVHADGGKYFGRALKQNSSLETLNLRLNRLGDEGGKMLLEGLAENATLTHLNLSCNALDHDSAQQLGVIVQASSSLQSLDLSCNVFSEEAGRLLRDGLQQNTTLTSLDLRLNQVRRLTTSARCTPYTTMHLHTHMRAKYAIPALPCVADLGGHRGCDRRDLQK